MNVHLHVDGAVGTLTLDRPERAHAYHRALLDELDAAVADAERRCAVLILRSTGEGAFCGGADLGELRKAGWADALDLRSQQVFTRLARAPFVSIAAVHGAAVAGGCELALACDLRVGGPRTRFSLPETALGLIPTAGGTTRLARLVGVARAKEVILGGRVVDPETALAWGLLHRLVENPRAEAAAWAVELSGRDATAMRKAKARLDADEPDAALLGERVSEAGLYERRRR